jgi:hypothetical protein
MHASAATTKQKQAAYAVCGPRKTFARAEPEAVIAR